MILVGNQRGGGRDLALHLMKPENERVEVAELRGFVADDLDGAFQESYAISRGTKCKQFLFSLSLSPPKGADVSPEQFKRAIDQAEAKLGLTGQPRAIVFHDKRGEDGALRHHAHAVWSRINVAEMKAVPLPHSHRKLQEVARELYLEHDWQMPRGLAVTGARDPRNFTLAEWQQAKRAGEDPRVIKAAFQDAWAISDSKAAFANALQERGYWLARGDRRGFVGVDHRGEIYAIAKWAGVKTKQVRERLGDEAALPSVAEAKRDIGRAMQAKMEEFQREVADKEAREREAAAREREALRARQQAERAALEEAARLRQQAEERERQSRLRPGLLGFWDRIRGERKRIFERNGLEAEAARTRDNAERNALMDSQLAQRRDVAQERAAQHHANEVAARSLAADAKTFRDMGGGSEREPQPDRSRANEEQGQRETNVSAVRSRQEPRTISPEPQQSPEPRTMLPEPQQAPEPRTVTPQPQQSPEPARQTRLQAFKEERTRQEQQAPKPNRGPKFER